jgi:hypothetical protein
MTQMSVSLIAKEKSVFLLANRKFDVPITYHRKKG